MRLAAHARLALLALTLVTACGETPRDGSGELDAAVAAAAGERRAPEQYATVGLDSVLLERAFERAEALPRLHSLLVARNGELVREAYFRGRGRDRPANIKSASKSIIAALVGIAIEDGHLEGLDQPIAPFFHLHLPDDADPRVRTITIENLLSMQSGLEPTSFGNYGEWVNSSNWVRYVVRRPFVDDPGGRMLYSTGSTHLLSAILTQATGQSTLAYARAKLARPLGFDLPAWTRDPQGIYFGGNEMGMRPRDMLVFAELFRNGGVHEGRRILPAEWIAASWQRRTTSPFNGHGYGLGWWMRTSNGMDVRFAWGYGGQFIFIVPDLGLTVVTTSDPVSPREGAHNRMLHDLMDELLVPAAIRGAG